MLRRYKVTIITSAIAALMLTGIVACNKDKNKQPATKEFDRNAMLKNIADNEILPDHDAFVVACGTLAEMLNSLSSTNTDLNSIVAAQAQWRKTANAWKRCELFNVGQVRDAYIHNKVHTWPANTSFIEQFISGADVLNETFIAGKGSSSKGIAAIEYLLFGDNGTQAVVDSLTSGAFAYRRLMYLQACGNNLRSVAVEINNIWSPASGNYYAAFVASLGTDTRASTNMLINEMSALVEKMANTKLGKPMGKLKNNVSDNSLAEAFRSEESLELIKSNLSALERVFHGGADTTTIGIDDNLNAVGAKYDDKRLSDKINEQFFIAKNALGNVSPAMSEALVSDRADMETAYAELKKLLVLFKTDVVSNLSITLTWSDNDGD